MLDAFSNANNNPARRSGRPRSNNAFGLSERQIEIIVLVAEGRKNKEIAETLCISEQTVKNHLHEIFPKAGVSDRDELSYWALRVGLLDPPGLHIVEESPALASAQDEVKAALLEGGQQFVIMPGRSGVNEIRTKADLEKVLVEFCLVAAPVNKKASAHLSPREIEVITCIARGYKNKEMAAKMFISEPTVKNHMHNIFDKLGVRDRLELALYAIHTGLFKAQAPFVGCDMPTRMELNL